MNERKNKNQIKDSDYDKKILEEKQDKNSMERIQGLTSGHEPYGGNEYSFI